MKLGMDFEDGIDCIEEMDDNFVIDVINIQLYI